MTAPGTLPSSRRDEHHTYLRRRVRHRRIGTRPITQHRVSRLHHLPPVVPRRSQTDPREVFVRCLRNSERRHLLNTNYAHQFHDERVEPCVTWRVPSLPEPNGQGPSHVALAGFPVPLVVLRTIDRKRRSSFLVHLRS